MVHTCSEIRDVSPRPSCNVADPSPLAAATPLIREAKEAQGQAKQGSLSVMPARERAIAHRHPAPFDQSSGIGDCEPVKVGLR